MHHTGGDWNDDLHAAKRVYPSKGPDPYREGIAVGYGERHTNQLDTSKYSYTNPENDQAFGWGTRDREIFETMRHHVRTTGQVPGQAPIAHVMNALQGTESSRVGRLAALQSRDSINRKVRSGQMADFDGEYLKRGNAGGWLTTTRGGRPGNREHLGTQFDIFGGEHKLSRPKDRFTDNKEWWKD